MEDQLCAGEVKRELLYLCWLNPERDEDLKLPAYQSEQASGMDVQAAVTSPVSIEPGEIVLLGTGFAVAINSGLELQVRSRSGLAVKHGITVINAPGTIDADYRGEVKIGLINLGKKSFTINRGDRIAQLVLAPVCHAHITVVEGLSGTLRHDGGFGHTGM